MADADRRRASVLLVLLCVLAGVLDGPWPGVALPAHMAVLAAGGMTLGLRWIAPGTLAVAVGAVVTGGWSVDVAAIVLLGGVVAVPVAATLDRIGGRHGPGRSTAALADLVVVSAAGAALYGTGLWLAVDAELSTSVLNSLVALHVVLPGVRVVLMRLPLRPPSGALSRPGAGLLAGAVLTTLAVATVGEDDVVLLAVLVQLGLAVLGAMRLGFPVVAVAGAGTALAAMTARLVVGTAPVDPGDGVLLVLDVIALAIFTIAIESDRARDVLTERDVTFRSGANPALVVDTVEPWVVVRANHRAGALVDGEPTGVPLVDVLGPAVAELAAAIGASTPSVRGVVELRIRGGTRLADVAVTWIRLRAPAAGRLYVEVVDITELVETSEALTRANEELSSIARTIAHDLAQPLAALAGFAETIRERDDELPPELRAQLLERLSASATGVRDRVADIVASAAAVGRAPAAVALRPVLDAATASLSLADEGVEFELDLAVEEVVVERAALVGVLGNLLDNAVKHRRAVRTTVVVRTRRLRGGVLLQVLDDGPGIDVADLERVMDLGTRLSPTAAGGSGQGLGAARRRALLAGCELTALPEATGARFDLWVPDGSGAAPLRVLFGLSDARHTAVLRSLLDHDTRVRDVGAVTEAEHLGPALGVARPDVLLLDAPTLHGVPAELRPVLSGPPLRTVVVADGASLTGVADLAHELGLEGTLTPAEFERGLAELLREAG